ncbi:MAG TPA: protein phosphatase 2C domain-containing protein [Desulfobacteria bacterium]|nr:protein phosphatase 2C domain-containing protein [Desulfobacteria bacterium]
MRPLPDISVCAKTDVGLKRTNNEDSYQLVCREGTGYDIDTFGMLFAVADGMGGHAGGEVASRVACQVLLEYYGGQLESGENVDPVEARLGKLDKVFWRIEKEIYRLSEEMPRYANMGTALSVLLLFKEHALIAHVGDSRIYRMRNGILEQLTEDETMAQLSLEMGYLKPDEVRGHQQGHILTQALGVGLEEVNTRVEGIESQDVYLLCSDGLYDMVSDERIRDILLEFRGKQGSCEKLLNTALREGGKDNVTVIVVGLE